MALQFLVLVLALALLLLGGEALVRGASAIARRFGLSATVIGLTVVAFGTSAPELAVSVSAAAGGSSGIAFGNVVGSNVANVALLLGLSAFLVPLTVDSTIVSREIPMMILAAAALSAVSLDGLLDGAPRAVISRSDGLALLLFFSVFLYYTAAGNLFGQRGDPLLEEARREASGRMPPPWGAVLLVLGGLVGLALGGNLIVSSASAIARSLGVGDVVIGATIVAVGTSLPELATSLVAARRQEADIAVANIVGSCIFNSLFVLGTTAVVRPVDVGPGGAFDLAVMVAVSVVLLPMAITHGRRITRGEGVVLLAIYAAYLVWQANR